LIFTYGGNVPLNRDLSAIVIEELDHFGQVLDLLERRGIKYRPLKPGTYGRKLQDLVRKGEPQRAIDRLLIGGLIEARSCERFSLLADHVQDDELTNFYRSLFESEARHHSTYVRLAKYFAADEDVMSRLQELAVGEAEIIQAGDPLPRMHS
jgi:tRNA-(ms[2]io[6]A)-hydroxylase